MKTEDKDYVKRDVPASVFNADEVNFLCGKEIPKGWKTKVDLEDDKLEFKGQDKIAELREPDGGHQLTKLEIVDTWDGNEAVYIVKEEDNAVSNKNAVRKVNNILNHKSKEHMYYAYRNAGKLSTKVRKLIDRVVENSEVCKKNSRSKSKPFVAISRATNFNSIVAVDLKMMEDKYIL